MIKEAFFLKYAIDRELKQLVYLSFMPKSIRSCQ
jgi:hypothetical protein